MRGKAEPRLSLSLEPWTSSSREAPGEASPEMKMRRVPSKSGERLHSRNSAQANINLRRLRLKYGEKPGEFAS